MEKFILYNCYHLNLAFSRIPEDHYSYVIDTCYWPFLNFCEKYNIRSGFEIPAFTLIEIEKRDKSFIKTLKNCIEQGYVELIGAGYAQTIFPLIPAEVNIKNLEIGNNYYRDLIGITPETVYVNEQCYSAGLVELYLEAGYKNVIMEVNNSMKNFNYDKRLWYSPQVLEGAGGAKINIIWNNSVMFQKFQRYAFGEISLKDYLTHLKNHRLKDFRSSLLLYGNDLEIFDYRPGNSDYIYNFKKKGEMALIENLYDHLNRDTEVEFILPGKLIEIYRDYEKQLIHLESAEVPLPTKKQDKYNPTRWAVAGRNNSAINTKCYRIYSLLKLIPVSFETSIINNLYEKLNYCWSSDFRTNTTEEKYLSCLLELGALHDKAKSLLSVSPATVTGDKTSIPAHGKYDISEDDYFYAVSTDSIFIELKKKKGFAINKLVYKKVDKRSLIGTIIHGYFDDITYSPDFYSGHCIYYSTDGEKTTDLGPVKKIIVEEYSEYIAVTGRIDFGAIALWKKYYIFNDENKIEIEYEFDLPKIRNNAFRAGIITINPSAFDIKSLYYETVNGGYTPERFFLSNESFDHTQPVDMKISSNHCLGATEGWVIIGDNDIKIRITVPKELSYSVPMLKFEIFEDTFFLRVFNTISEYDETSHLAMRGILRFKMRIEAEKNQ